MDFTGKACIFKTPNGGGTWTELQQLLASDAGGDDYFGYDVAMYGNVIVISAIYQDEGHFNTNNGDCCNYKLSYLYTNYDKYEGALYVFTLHNGLSTWTQQQRLFPSDPSSNDNFGTSIAMDGTVLAASSEQDDNVQGDDAGQTEYSCIELSKVTNIFHFCRGCIYLYHL